MSEIKIFEDVFNTKSDKHLTPEELTMYIYLHIARSKHSEVSDILLEKLVELGTLRKHNANNKTKAIAILNRLHNKRMIKIHAIAKYHVEVELSEVDKERYFTVEVEEHFDFIKQLSSSNLISTFYMTRVYEQRGVEGISYTQFKETLGFTEKTAINCVKALRESGFITAKKQQVNTENLKNQNQTKPKLRSIK